MDDDPDAPTAPAARWHGRRRLPQVLWALTLVALAVAVGGFVTDANTVPQEGVPGNNGSRGLWLGILGGMGATLAGLAASLTSLSSPGLRRSGVIGLAGFAVFVALRAVDPAENLPKAAASAVVLVPPLLLAVAAVLAFLPRGRAADTGQMSDRDEGRVG